MILVFHFFDNYLELIYFSGNLKSGNDAFQGVNKIKHAAKICQEQPS